MPVGVRGVHRWGGHRLFTAWGFRSFTGAAFFWAIAIFRHGKNPKRYAWIWVGFGSMPAGDILLTALGPSIRSVRGNMIQATGQEVIIYAAVFSIFIESYGARVLNSVSRPDYVRDRRRAGGDQA